MKGRIKDFLIAANGDQHITVITRQDFREQYSELKDTDISVDIKKYRRPRSLGSNAYAWILIDKIAEMTGADKETVYRESIRQIGGVSETVCVKQEAAAKLINGWSRTGLGWQAETMPSKLPGCVNVILYYGSSVYDTAQMSALIDRLVCDAKELGIETDTPEQLARYKDEWRGTT